MPTFPLTAINVDSFNLGESDKVITLFSRERGISKGVAKGARKPGSKISGKAELLCVNNLYLAKGKTFDIITQAQSIETFPNLRVDLERLTYGLYFAELTKSFGKGLEEDAASFFEILVSYLIRLSDLESTPVQLGLEFEFTLLACLGLQPELRVCVLCREALTEYSISAFIIDMGGICCQSCSKKYARTRKHQVSEPQNSLLLEQAGEDFPKLGTYVTPLVWKYLSKAAIDSQNNLDNSLSDFQSTSESFSEAQKRSLNAAGSVIQKYLEDKAGRKMKSLDLLKSL